MQHNGSALTRVKGADPEHPHWAAFQYEASLGQLLATVARSRHCQQLLEFYCRRSRLQDSRGRCPPADSPCQPQPYLLRCGWRQRGEQVQLDPGADAYLSLPCPVCPSVVLWAVQSFLLIASSSHRSLWNLPVPRVSPHCYRASQLGPCIWP